MDVIADLYRNTLFSVDSLMFDLRSGYSLVHCSRTYSGVDCALVLGHSPEFQSLEFRMFHPLYS